jgi:hypothetical protein
MRDGPYSSDASHLSVYFNATDTEDEQGQLDVLLKDFGSDSRPGHCAVVAMPHS